jgi:hypothetical protein
MPGIDRESAALLLSLFRVETSGVPMNNSPGNVTASSRWEGDAWRPPWFEPNQTNPKLAALHDRMLAGEAPSAFRAYSTPAAGFADWARVLKANFASVLAAAQTGDPHAFVRALHDSGYSKDYSAAHFPTFVQLREKFLPLVAHLPAGASGVAGAGALALFGLGLYLAYRYSKGQHA